MKKTIRWYRKIQYGTEREFVHPDCAGDAQLIRQLTGQKTIDGRIRELIRDLTACAVEFQDVLCPAQEVSR
jgi:hypothetical protein